MEKNFFLMILVISTFVYSLGSFPIYQLKKKKLVRSNCIEVHVHLHKNID